MTTRILAAAVAAAFMGLSPVLYAQGTGIGAGSGSGMGTGTNGGIGTGSRAIGAPGQSTFGSAPSIGGSSTLNGNAGFGSSSSFGGSTTMPGLAPSPTFPSEGMSSNPSGFGVAPTPNFGTTPPATPLLNSNGLNTPSGTTSQLGR